jgi:hypothetical protein
MVGPAGLIIGAEVAGRVLDKASRPSPKDQKGPQPELWALLGDAASHILQHMETVAPRHEDVDIAHNSIDTGRLDSTLTTRPNGDITAVNGTPLVLKFAARQGFVAHVSGIDIKSRNPAQSLTGVAVQVEMNGRVIQRVSSLRFVRPVMLDRDDVLAIIVTNTSGGDLALEYSILGWLRAHTQG